MTTAERNQAALEGLAAQIFADTMLGIILAVEEADRMLARMLARVMGRV